MVSVVPKSVGSAFRVKDDRQAPWAVKKNTLRREGAILAQVTGYSIIIDRSVKALESLAQKMIRNGEISLFPRLIQKLQGNKALFLIGLSASSNYIAESVSRKWAPRNIWEGGHSIVAQKDSDDDDNDDNKSLKEHSCPQERPIQHKPIPFCSNLQSPVAPNPFRGAVNLPPIARPAFSL